MSYSGSYDQISNSNLLNIASNYCRSNSSSKTIPNYQCPGCGSRIYFFQSSDGGKVLFDSLGKPWPKHDCIVMQYRRKKASLKISINDWTPLSGLITTPSGLDDSSVFSGVIHDGERQSKIELILKVDELILIKDVYIDAKCTRVVADNIELLVIFDDGRHRFINGEISKISAYEMEDLSCRGSFTKQPKLL